MRVGERGITSPKGCSCWHAARDWAPWEATFRHGWLVAGKGDGPGMGRPGTQDVRGETGGQGGLPSMTNALLDACAGTGITGLASRAMAAPAMEATLRAGRAAPAGHRPSPEFVTQEFG